MANKPILTIKADANGVKISKEGKPEKRNSFIQDWAAFRKSLPVKKD